MSTRIDRLLPYPSEDLDDEQILAHYLPPKGSWLRMNFITSLDGAGTRAGRSGGLGDDADRRIFDLLRRHADVVLVGAGTIRTEGYSAMRVSADDAAWRAAHGMPAHPMLAIVSGSLNLDPDSEVFTNAPVRPIVFTLETASLDRRRQLENVASIVVVGVDALDASAMRAHLESRGLLRIHSEGGPHLFGALIEAGIVDELCLTIAPSLEAGDAGRIAASQMNAPQQMSLAGLLRADDELFLRMVARERLGDADQNLRPG